MKTLRYYILFHLLFLISTVTVFANNKVESLLPFNKEEARAYREVRGINVNIPTEDFQSAILPRLISMFLAIAGAITTIVFVYSGVMLVTHLGNEEIVTKFKKMLVFSAVGLGFIVTAYGIVSGILRLSFT